MRLMPGKLSLSGFVVLNSILTYFSLEFSSVLFFESFSVLFFEEKNQKNFGCKSFAINSALRSANLLI
jgi:hypothetical protein